VSRDRDCCGLTNISEILGGRQRFGMRQRFDHFECGGLVQTGRYSTGESPPMKAGHRELLPHLESTCRRINISAKRRTRPSAGPERSQQLQILPSLIVRQFFSGSAYSSCCANIFVGANIFPCAKVLASAKDFGCVKVLSSAKDFGCAKVLASAKDFEGANVFVSPKVFGCANVFVYILWHLYFVYFPAFLFSMRLIGANVLIFLC
jgi:hypothetical protein